MAKMSKEPEVIILRNQLNIALGILADWCVAVQLDGAKKEHWYDCYRDAMYSDGPLRTGLDKAIVEARARRSPK